VDWVWSVGQLWGELQAPVAAETRKHPPKAPLLKARLEDCVVVLASCLPPSRFLRVEEPPPLPPGARRSERGRDRVNRRRRMSTRFI
jgi:hypothetical protein